MQIHGAREVACGPLEFRTGLTENPSNLVKTNVSSNLEGKCQEVKRCAPLRRAQETQCHTMDTLENNRFLHVRTDAMQCRPLSPSAEHEKSYGYWKTFENQWENMVSGHCRSKIKNDSLRIPFRAKADSKIYPLGTIGKTLEIIGKSWFPDVVGPRLKTAPSGPLASEERWQNKKQAWICWFRPSDLISSHVIWP